MNGQLKLFVLGFVLAAPAFGQVSGELDSATEFEGALANARRVAAEVIAGDAEFILANSDPKFVEKFGGEAKLRAFITKLPVQFVKETKLDHDRLRLRAVGPVFARIIEVEKAKPIRIQVGFDGITGLINSLSVGPAAGKGAPVAPRVAKTRLTLPIGMPRAGHVWVVGNGGAAVIDNYHARLDTYYAIDIAPRPLTALTDVSSPEAHPCWSLPIKAAAPGKVAIVRDGMPDGPVRGPSGPGNHVILDHGNGEFTLYAHLQQGSIGVTPNQRVARGQAVGRCGKSGNTEAPHLHFQLMDGSDLQTARGIPPVFDDNYAPVRYVERGTLSAGDVVLPAIPLGKTTQN